MAFEKNVDFFLKKVLTKYLLISYNNIVLMIASITKQFNYLFYAFDS